MADKGNFAHIVRRDDGSRFAVWGGFELFTAFQPIFAFGRDAKLAVAAVECLLRPQRGGRPVSPYRFFSAVPPEERAEIETLTRNLHLLNAGRFAGPTAMVFVNFDPSQFASRQSVDEALSDIRFVVDEATLDPARIVCELTEQKSASPLVLKHLMLALRACGFRIAVDDYGAEDSDFERIVQMNPDIVKFDARWVAKLMQSASGYALLKSMVGRITARSIDTVIEGIEEPWQLELAEKMGATMVQGFGVARPQIALASVSGAKTDPETGNSGPVETSMPTTAVLATRHSQHVFGRRR